MKLGWLWPGYRCPYCGRKFVYEHFDSYNRHKDGCAAEAQRKLDAEFAAREMR